MRVKSMRVLCLSAIFVALTTSQAIAQSGPTTTDSDVFTMIGPYALLNNLVGIPISYPAPIEGAEVTHCLGEDTETALWLVLGNQQPEDFEIYSDRYTSQYDWRYWDLDEVPGEQLSLLEALGVHFFPVVFKSDWRTAEGDYQAKIKVSLKVPALTLKRMNHEDFQDLQAWDDADLVGVAYGISQEITLTGHVVDCPEPAPEPGDEPEDEPVDIVPGGEPEIIIDPPIDPLKDAEFTLCPGGPEGTGPSFGDMDSCLDNPEYIALISLALSNGLSENATWSGYIGTLTSDQYARLLELCPFEMGPWVMPPDQPEVWLKPGGDSAQTRFDDHLGYLENQRRKRKEEEEEAKEKQKRDAYEKEKHKGQSHNPCECWDLTVEVDFSDSTANQYITSHDPTFPTILNSDQVGFIRGRSIETDGLYDLPYAVSVTSPVGYWELYEELVVNLSTPPDLREKARQRDLSCCWTSHELNHNTYVQVINYAPMGNGIPPTVPSAQPFNLNPTDVYEALALWTSYTSTPANYFLAIANGSSIQQGSITATGLEGGAASVGFPGKRMEWVYDWFNFAPSQMTSGLGGFSACDIAALGPVMWAYWAASHLHSGHGTRALRSGLGKVELVIDGQACPDKTVYYQTLASEITFTRYEEAEPVEQEPLNPEAPIEEEAAPSKLDALNPEAPIEKEEVAPSKLDTLNLEAPLEKTAPLEGIAEK